MCLLFLTSRLRGWRPTMMLTVGIKSPPVSTHPELLVTWAGSQGNNRVQFSKILIGLITEIIAHFNNRLCVVYISREISATSRKFWCCGVFIEKENMLRESNNQNKARKTQEFWVLTLQKWRVCTKQMTSVWTPRVMVWSRETSPSVTQKVSIHSGCFDHHVKGFAVWMRLV